MTRGTAPLALATALTLLLLAAAPPDAAAAREPAPIAVDAGFKPADQAREIVEITDASYLKNIRRVAVTQFNVQFVTSDSQSAETSGFGAAGRASATATYKLAGVGEPDFQALAEALHARFLDELQASGLQVVAAPEVAAAPTWRKLVAAGSPLPERGDTLVTVAPPGMAMYGASRLAAPQPKSGGVFGAFAAMGAGLSAAGQLGDNAELQKELGGAALLEVTMRVHFAQLTNENRGFFGRLSSTASVSGKVYPSVSQARVMVHNGPAVVNVSLKAPLALDAAAFADLREQPKTAGETAGAVAAGLLRMAIGNKDSASFTTYEAVAEPARWRDVVGAGLGSAGSVLVERLRLER